MTRPARLVFAILVGVILHSRVVQAEPITYTESVTGSGSLNGVRFTDALITLTATGDTNGIVALSPDFYANSATVNFTVAGSGNGMILGPTLVFDNQFNPTFGIGTGTPAAEGPDILDVSDPFFATYRLDTAIGSVSGTVSGNPGAAFASTSGDFVIDSFSSDASLTVTTSAVPEPSSLALCGIAGVMGLVRWGRRCFKGTV